MEFEFSIAEIDNAAKNIIESNPRKIILFNGEMGAGKTTLIKAICEQLGASGNISSPTFSLVNEYPIPDGKIFHFDMYRLKTPSEALDMGIEEYFDSGHWCFVEWPEKIEGLIPDDHSVVDICIGDDLNRQVRMD